MVGVAATAATLFTDPDRQRIAIAVFGLLQGLAAGLVNRRRRSKDDTPWRALIRLALLTPILVLPAIYLIFRERLVLPFVALLVSWALGGCIPFIWGTTSTSSGGVESQSRPS
jgi:hypothetical protein